MKSTEKIIPAVIIRSLARMQDGLNTMIDPSWRQVRSFDDWSLAITMESAELLDSYPWKWWKNVNSEPDLKNVTIELVDILHFSLSGTMLMQSAHESNMLADVKNRMQMTMMPILPTSAEYETAVQGMFFFPLCDKRNAIATFRNVIQLAERYQFEAITEGVIASANDLNFNVVAYYVAKHTLNCIRQLGGYKSGDYVKVKSGVEDNMLLHDCISDVIFDEVISEEEHVKAWNKIVERVYDAFQIPINERKNVQYWTTLVENDKKRARELESEEHHFHHHDEHLQLHN